MAFLAAAPAFTGASCLALLLRRASRVLLLRLDRLRQLLVSHKPGTVTLLGFYFFGTSLPCALTGLIPLVPRAVRPRHLSRIEKEQQRAEEEYSPEHLDGGATQEKGRERKEESHNFKTPRAQVEATEVRGLSGQAHEQ